MSMNILEEWTHLKPTKIIDGRNKIPHHKTLKWESRNIEDIIGICCHQTAGNDNPINTAQYHVDHFPRAKNKKGAPSLCYTFYIRKSGEIWWCNDIESVTWSQGYAKRPGSENVEFVSVVCGGDFSGPGYKGREEPTNEQMQSLREVLEWLKYHLKLTNKDIFGHTNFGKMACPGNTIMNLIEKNKNSVEETNKELEWTDRDWQQALSDLGYNLGKSGVDGIWGNKSKAALTKFQMDNKIKVIGYKDDLTKVILKKVLKK